MQSGVSVYVWSMTTTTSISNSFQMLDQSAQGVGDMARDVVTVLPPIPRRTCYRHQIGGGLLGEVEVSAEGGEVCGGQWMSLRFGLFDVFHFEVLGYMLRSRLILRSLQAVPGALRDVTELSAVGNSPAK